MYGTDRTPLRPIRPASAHASTRFSPGVGYWSTARMPTGSRPLRALAPTSSCSISRMRSLRRTSPPPATTSWVGFGAGNTDWVRINGFGTPWWVDDLADTGRHLGRRGDAGDGRIGGPCDRDSETTAQRAHRGAGRNGPGSGTYHRDRRGQRHVPARLRHRRFPPGHRFRRRPRPPWLTRGHASRSLPRRPTCPVRSTGRPLAPTH